MFLNKIGEEPSSNSNETCVWGKRDMGERRQTDRQTDRQTERKRELVVSNINKRHPVFLCVFFFFFFNSRLILTLSYPARTSPFFIYSRLIITLSYPLPLSYTSPPPSFPHPLPFPLPLPFSPPLLLESRRPQQQKKGDVLCPRIRNSAAESSNSIPRQLGCGYRV